jgi:arginyl-tRNA synthetase
MVSIEAYLTQVVCSAFQDLGFCNQETMATVRISDRSDLSDYQCNGALSLAKVFGRPPQEIAIELQRYLAKTLSDVEIFVAGPGFLNFKLSNRFLINWIQSSSPKPQKKSLETVIFDYGGPNVAKPMHVGHLRSSIIGECLKRLFQYKGHPVIADIHLGDWGTQMGMLIIALKHQTPNLPYFDPNFQGPYPKDPPVSLEDLQDIYPKISAACAENEALSSEAREATYELQQGRPGYRALWQHFVDVSVEDMKKNFDRLNVSFDQWFGESRYQEKIPALIQNFKEKGLVQESQGALIIEVAEEGDKKEVPPLILQKSDGGFLYATTDLATLDERVGIFKADRIVYVVDGRQELHFEQLFRAARKLGYKVKTDFIGFGTMNGPDNKPFKTRSGGAMRLEELIESLKEEALKKMRETKAGEGFSIDKQEEIAEKIGIAALKFADLQHNPVQNYQFDLKKFMSFEGKTGPYLLYALVRIISILEKAEVSNASFTHKELLPQERDILLKILQQADVLERAYKSLSPHILCDYAFELAQSFSRFYQICPILSEPNQERKETRLFLCTRVFEALNLTLNLLGIVPVSKM